MFIHSHILRGNMLQRLLTQLSDLSVLAGISFAFALVKLVLAPEPANFKIGLASVFCGVVVGTLAGAIALSMGWNDYIAMSCSSFASLLSRDLVIGIINNKGFLGTLVKQAAGNLTDKFTK